MEHKPSVRMTDERGDFQRCWVCGGRRGVAALGFGIWSTGTTCEPTEDGSDKTPEAPRTRQELLDDLFAQPSPFDKRG